MRGSAALLLSLAACHSHSTSSSESRSSEHATSQVLSTSDTTSRTDTATSSIRTEGPERIDETVTMEEEVADRAGVDAGPRLRRTVTHRVIERGQVTTSTSRQTTATVARRTDTASTSTRATEATSRTVAVKDSAPVGLPSARWVWGAVVLLLLGGVGWWWLRRAA